MLMSEGCSIDGKVFDCNPTYWMMANAKYSDSDPVPFIYSSSYCTALRRAHPLPVAAASHPL